MKILQNLNGDKAIIDIGSDVIIKEDSVQMNNTIYLGVGRVIVHDVAEVPEGIEPIKWCYDITKGFYRNPNYRPFVSVEERFSLLEKATSDLILNGGAL